MSPSFDKKCFKIASRSAVISIKSRGHKVNEQRVTVTVGSFGTFLESSETFLPHFG